MMRSLWTAASGMTGQQFNIDTISNNLANVNTTGFKKDKAEFQDLLYQTTRTPGADQGAGNQLPELVKLFFCRSGVLLEFADQGFQLGDALASAVGKTGERDGNA